MKKQRKSKDATPELTPSNVTVLPPESPADEMGEAHPVTEIPEVALVIQQNQIAGPRATELQGAFREFFTEAGTLIEQAGTINIESADQLADMATARHLRLKLKTVRVSADKRREALKQDSLREGRAIQGFYNVLEHLIAPVEEKLLKMEQFAEEQARLIKENRRMEREAALLAVGFSGIDHMNLSEMPDDDFTTILKDATFLHESKLRRAAEEKAEMERAARERAEAEAKEKAERIARGQVRRAALDEDGIGSLFICSDVFLADMSEVEFQTNVSKAKTEIQRVKDAEAEAERLRQERAEAERAAAEEKALRDELHRNRHELLARCGITVHHTMDLSAMDLEQFEIFRTGELDRMEREAEEEAERVRIHELAMSRRDECRTLGYRIDHVDFSTMDEAEYDVYKQSEVDRLESECQAEAERQRLADEALIAREAAEAAAKVEADRKAAEAAAQKEREAAERRAARAPDKQKLEAWLESLPADMPSMKTDAGELAMQSIKQKFLRFLGEAQKVVSELS
jgi:hypothetical protein